MRRRRQIFDRYVDLLGGLEAAAGGAIDPEELMRRAQRLRGDREHHLGTALREIGLAAGEPPATRGYPPSMWSRLPRLVERAGNDPRGGSITGGYTVLMEGDDPHEPVVDAARSLLDGHVQLSRELAEGGLFPPVDVLASVSRVMGSVVSQAHADLARNAREALATYRRVADRLDQQLTPLAAALAGLGSGPLTNTPPDREDARW